MGFEYVHENVLLVVSDAGKISFVPTDKTKDVFPKTMPPMEFWQKLANMIAEMKGKLESCDKLKEDYDKLKEDCNKLKESYDLIIKEENENIRMLNIDIEKLREEKRKIIPVGANKKNMFMAGVVFGKNGLSTKSV